MEVSNPLLFGVFTNLFVVGWLFLTVALFLSGGSNLRKYLLLLGGRVIPIILLASFVVGWILTRGMPGDITTFDGVITSFSVPEKVLNAWFEVLGLALLVARWIVDDSSVTNTPKLIVLVSLVGTFIAAAIGLLFYLLMRSIWSKVFDSTDTL